MDRIPPHDERAERGILGSIIQKGDIIDLCVEQGITPASFYVPAHRLVFEASLELSAQGKAIDQITIAERIDATTGLDKIGGETFLGHLIDDTPTTAHVSYYIDIVRRKEIRRTTIETARQAEADCFSSDEDDYALLAEIEQRFFSIVHGGASKLVEWGQAVAAVIERMHKTKQGTGDPDALKVGFSKIDSITAGLRPGNMIILAGRPSMGKTSLAMNIAENVAKGHTPNKTELPVGVFSLEMSTDDLAARMISTHAKVSMHRIRQGYIMGGDEARRLEEAAQILQKAPIHVDDSPSLDITEVRARARRMKSRHNIALLIIDYLQLLHCKQASKQGRQLETGAISAGLKALAKELHIPVIVLSQLSRAPEGRNDGIPRLSDLRDSGSIEQDADQVFLIRRPCKLPKDKETDDTRLAIIDLAKNRNGPTDDRIRMNFDEELTLFSDRTEAFGFDGELPPLEGDDFSPPPDDYDKIKNSQGGSL